MKLHTRHLTYCTNVHPGESWAALRDSVLPHVVDVKARMTDDPSVPFGVGLRLSAQAASELQDPVARAQLKDLLARHGLYVFTLNGFPYGNFSGSRVKAAVYEPDWRTRARLEYTNQLASLLAELLPSELAYGSISTVPFGYRDHFREPAAWQAAVDHLLEHVAFLHALAQQTGRRIVLALEPEPFCALESIADCEQVFAHRLRSPEALAKLAQHTQTNPVQARAILQAHLGICLDTCHAAVEFEQASEVLPRLRAANIPIYKIQLSAGLRIPELNASTRDALGAFAEDVYLHQVVEQREGALFHFVDLPEALTNSQGSGAREWRVHFHVPIFHRELGSFESTQEFLIELLATLLPEDCAHLEVETYTWNVLPAFLRAPEVSEDIANELRWARAQLERGPAR